MKFALNNGDLLKMKVLLVFGGKSSEFEVSCASAASVIRNIKGHELTKLGITKDGKWFITDSDADEIQNCKWVSNGSNKPVFIDVSNGAFIVDGEPLKFDVVFPVIHGRNGEDGRLQGLLEMMNVKYVGCRLLSSAVCMDKAYTNLIFEANGIKHTPWVSFTRYEYEKNKDLILDNIVGKLKYPLFVKPSNAGSSVGITKCKNYEDIIEGIDEALKFDSKIIVEQSVENPLEIEVAVMGNDEPIASTTGMIKAANDFYDYEAKYINSASETLIPADIDRELSEKIRKTAVAAYKACECKGLSRVDFLVSETGDIYINEINTLPGFTNISMFPKLFIAEGMSYSELINKLIDFAISYKE